MAADPAPATPSLKDVLTNLPINVTADVNGIIDQVVQALDSVSETLGSVPLVPDILKTIDSQIAPEVQKIITQAGETGSDVTASLAPLLQCVLDVLNGLLGGGSPLSAVSVLLFWHWRLNGRRVDTNRFCSLTLLLLSDHEPHFMRVGCFKRLWCTGSGPRYTKCECPRCTRSPCPSIVRINNRIYALRRWGHLSNSVTP